MRRIFLASGIILAVFLSETLYAQFPMRKATPFTIQEVLPPAEYQALVDLFNSTGGHSWTHQDSWLNGNFLFNGSGYGAISTWYGVYVEYRIEMDGDTYVLPEYGYVKMLDLRSNNLRGPLPSSMGNCTRLAELYMSDNHLSGKIPESMQQCYLSDVWLQRNQLDGPIPEWFGNSRNWRLNLCANQFSGSLPLSMTNLPSGTFTYVDVSDNYIYTNDAAFALVTNIWANKSGTFIPLPQKKQERRELQGIEITQCVQNWNNDVPLIAGKKTYLVAHILSSIQSDKNRAFMLTVGLNNGAQNTTLTRIVKVPYFSDLTYARSSYDRATDDSVVIEIPEEWCHNYLTVSLNADDLVSKSGFAGSTDSNGNPGVLVYFRNDVPAITVRFMPFSWEDTDLNGHYVASRTEVKDVDSALSELRSTIPAKTVSKGHVFAITDLEVFSSKKIVGKPMSEDDFDCLCKKLKKQRCADQAPDDFYYIGILSGKDLPTHKTGDQVNGMAYDFSNRMCVAYFPGIDNLTPCHELGHCFGMWHSPSVDRNHPENCDQNNPDFVSSDGDRTHNEACFGLDGNGSSPSVVSCNDGDIMSYNPASRWPSAYTYTNEMAYLISHPIVPFDKDRELKSCQAVPLVVSALSGGLTFMVSGKVSKSPVSGKIEDIQQFNAFDSLPPPQGDWTISIQDQSGQQLAVYAFTPSYGVDNSDDGFFVLVLPWVASAHRMVLLHKGTVLDTVTCSANAPAITMLGPSGVGWTNDPVVVSWDASDLDGDPLTYDVQWSSDSGSNWMTVVMGLATNLISIPASTLPGTTQAMFRVLASDGFNTTEARSAAPGSLSAKPPTVTVLSPQNMQNFSGPVDISFSAIASDLQDGELSSSNVIWQSDRDGVIGTGSVLNVIADSLSEGSHVITTDAVGSSGLHTTQSVTITVVRDANLNGIPDSWETLYFGSTTGAVSDQDPDYDGMTTWQEYVAGSDPTNAASVFQFKGLSGGAGQGMIIRWPSISNRFYNLSRATNLLQGSNAFTVLPDASNLSAVPPENSYTDMVQGVGPFFYKVDVSLAADYTINFDEVFFDNFQQFANGTILSSTNYVPASGPMNASVSFQTANGSSEVIATNFQGGIWAFADTRVGGNSKYKGAFSAKLNNRVVDITWPMWIQSTNSGTGGFLVNLLFNVSTNGDVMYNPLLFLTDDGQICVATNTSSSIAFLSAGNWGQYVNTVMTNRLTLDYPAGRFTFSINGSNVTNMPISSYFTNVLDAVRFQLFEGFGNSVGNHFAWDDVRVKVQE